MKRACPNLKKRDIVYLNRTYFDLAQKQKIYERTGYKVINITGNGEAIWQ
ncbi:hypothetical protein QWY77_01030 [Thalassotalea ponticola]|nr:hypothetical protein [Thalassotalea ponticola]MDN3651368.1 hypothetical protein [Thalassotalea ponticola]